MLASQKPLSTALLASIPVTSGLLWNVKTPTPYGPSPTEASCTRLVGPSVVSWGFCVTCRLRPTLTRLLRPPGPKLARAVPLTVMSTVTLCRLLKSRLASALSPSNVITYALSSAPSPTLVSTGFCSTSIVPEQVVSPPSVSVLTSDPGVTDNPPTVWRYGRLTAGMDESPAMVSVPVTALTQASAAALAALLTVTSPSIVVISDGPAAQVLVTGLQVPGP